jgi:hypothetical protein
MLILLENDISENPGPFDNEISIFHLNIRSIRHKLDYVEALALGSSIVRVEGFSFAYRQIYIILIFNNPTISITIHVSQCCCGACSTPGK